MIFIIQGFQTIVFIFVIFTTFQPICPLSIRIEPATSEEDWKTYWLKHCEYNNKNEENSPKSLNDKNTFEEFNSSVLKRKNLTNKLSF